MTNAKKRMIILLTIHALALCACSGKSTGTVNGASAEVPAAASETASEILPDGTVNRANEHLIKECEVPGSAKNPKWNR